MIKLLWFILRYLKPWRTKGEMIELWIETENELERRQEEMRKRRTAEYIGGYK